MKRNKKLFFMVCLAASAMILSSFAAERLTDSDKQTRLDIAAEKTKRESLSDDDVRRKRAYCEAFLGYVSSDDELDDQEDNEEITMVARSAAVNLLACSDLSIDDQLERATRVVEPVSSAGGVLRPIARRLSPSDRSYLEGLVRARSGAGSASSSCAAAAAEEASDLPLGYVRLRPEEEFPAGAWRTIKSSPVGMGESSAMAARESFATSSCASASSSLIDSVVTTREGSTSSQACASSSSTSGAIAIRESLPSSSCSSCASAAASSEDGAALCARAASMLAKGVSVLRGISDTVVQCGTVPVCGSGQHFSYADLSNGEMVCLTCGKHLPGRVALARHVRIHADPAIRAYKCSFCGKRFLRNGDMKTHERSHTQEHPYRCAGCSMPFKTISNLRRHERTCKRCVAVPQNKDK